MINSGIFSFFNLPLASCGQTYFNSSRGTVQSPNSYGYNYATGLDCKYDISVRSGNGVKLWWRTFDVKGHMPSCNNDYVEIYIGCRSDQRSIGRFCSENSQKPFNVYSPDGCLQLVFRNDSSGGGKGFQADYERISPGNYVRLSKNHQWIIDAYNIVGGKYLFLLVLYQINNQNWLWCKKVRINYQEGNFFWSENPCILECNFNINSSKVYLRN